MKTTDSTSSQTKTAIEIFQIRDNQISFEVNVFDETVWLNQKQMAELFDKDRKTVAEHIGNIFKEGELEQNSTCRKFQLVQIEGNRKILRDVEHYNLDVIISVGYRVKSKRGIQFRQWATRVLKQYLLNGYAVNESRVKKIEESLDELVSSHKLLKDDVDGIKNLLLKLIERPIVIHNHNNISSKIGINPELEESLINLLNEITIHLKDEKTKAIIKFAKQDLAKISQKPDSKNRLLNFLRDIGDQNSDLYKKLKGAGIAKDIILELIRISKKMIDLVK